MFHPLRMIKGDNINLPSRQINNTSFPHSVVYVEEGELGPLGLQQVRQEAGRSSESLVETVRTVGRARSRLERVRLHELCELERPMEMLLVRRQPVIITNNEQISLFREQSRYTCKHTNVKQVVNMNTVIKDHKRHIPS